MMRSVSLIAAVLCFSLLAHSSANAEGVRGTVQDVIKKVRCLRAKPTLFVVAGFGGSQMSGTHAGSDVCPPLPNKTVVWFADKWFLQRNLTCWSHLMSLPFDPATGKWHNSSGTELWPDDSFQGFPDRAKQKAYYAGLVKHLLTHHGYVLGKDLFVITYDWRIGIQGLEESGGLDRIAQKISVGVESNCGQKGIVLTHSFAANIMAHMLHKPELKAWREHNVKGWVPIGGPFGGTAATVWLSILNGDFFKLFPIVSNLLPARISSRFPITVISRSTFNFAFGLPSWGYMFPREFTLGKEHVVVSTPTRNYTVADQKQLLLDMGDVGGASILDQSWRINDHAMEMGPVPGVETYCLYSTSVPTATTLVYNQPVPYKFVMRRPVDVVRVAGDGVVDLTSLRLCKKFTSDDRLIEVDGPLVDHSTVLSHPLGLEGLSHILAKLGVPGRPSLYSITRRLFRSASQTIG